MPTLSVCATPDAGFWQIGDGGVAELYEKIDQHGGNYTVPCSLVGMDPRTAWTLDEEDDFPVTGFCAEMLLQIVSNMGAEWDCIVHFLPTYVRTHSARALVLG